jgi:dTDP-glucose 4,6-dehydratase
MLPNLKKFLYVSTDEVYGECETKKTETDILHPKNPYSSSKAAGSLMHMAYENTYQHMKGKIVETRFCNVFGPRQDKRKIIPLLKHAITTGTKIPIHNGGSGFREYIYIKNIPSALELILDKGDGVYNLTLNDGLTVSKLIEIIERLSNKKVPTIVANRPGMDLKYQMDSSRIRSLGWKPTYSFEEGLKEYLLD